MASPNNTAVALPFEFKVAGTGYERRYSVIRRYCALRSEARLIPQHDNPFDPHAIEVRMRWLTSVGSEVWDQIGFVPQDVSATVNALISSGEWAIENVFVRKVDASPELDAPRVTVRIEGKDLRVKMEEVR